MDECSQLGALSITQYPTRARGIIVKYQKGLRNYNITVIISQSLSTCRVLITGSILVLSPQSSEANNLCVCMSGT